MTVPPPDSEQRAEDSRERPDRRQPREPRGHGGHTTNRARSHGRDARCRPAPGHRGPTARGDPVRHRRHARADRDARRGGARARQGVAPARPRRPPLRPRRLHLRARRRGRPPARGRRRDRLRRVARRGAARAGRVPTRASRPRSRAGPGASRTSSAERDDPELRRLRVRIERKGPIVAFHWRGVPDEDAARTRLEGIAKEAEAEGLDFHWGRKVLEVRPPVPVDKGQAVRELVERSGVQDGALRRRRRDRPRRLRGARLARRGGGLDAAVKIGVRSSEGPAGDRRAGRSGRRRHRRASSAVLEALAGE